MDATSLRRAADNAARLRPELTWLQDVRSRALDAFVNGGFPTTAEEDWRYTDLREAAELAERYWAEEAQPATRQQDAAIRARLVPAGAGTEAVFTDGAFRVDLSRLPATPGLTVLPLSQATPQMRDSLALRIAGATEATSSGLAALNATLLLDGLIIEVAAGVVLEKPIYVALAGTTDSASHNRLLVKLGAGSKATLIEHHVSLGASVSNSLTEIICGPESRLAYVKLQGEATAAIHLASQRLSVDRGAQAEVLHLDLGARLARNDLRVELSGDGAEVTAHGLFFADASRHLDNHTRIDHQAPRTRSRELYRGIADGKGRGVFNGKIIVHAGAVKADARLTNQNLLLSRTAEVDTKPELEIYTDDVKCSHGATTGQLDGNSIFYLRSRGISADQARRMLIASFAREIVKRVPAGALEAHVVAALRDRLPELREVADSL